MDYMIKHNLSFLIVIVEVGLFSNICDLYLMNKVLCVVTSVLNNFPQLDIYIHIYIYMFQEFIH